MRSTIAGSKEIDSMYVAIDQAIKDHKKVKLDLIGRDRRVRYTLLIDGEEWNPNKVELPQAKVWRDLLHAPWKK